MHADMAGMRSGLETGADSDVAFLRVMIRRRGAAIDIAQVALQCAVHQDLRDLARDVVLVQAEEVHRYQTWLDAKRSD